MKRTRTNRSVLLAMGMASAILSHTALADTNVYWDPQQTASTGGSGSGTWANNGGSYWFDGSSNMTWSTNSYLANFNNLPANTTATITVNGAISTAGLNFGKTYSNSASSVYELVSGTNAGLSITTSWSSIYVYSGTARISVPITSVVGGINLYGNMILDGANTYSGATTINAVNGSGTITAGRNNVFGTTADLKFQGGTVDLNGTSQQLNVLRDNGTTAGGFINSSNTLATLTVWTAVTNTFSPTISGKIQLVKNGNGKETLTNANTYTGSTTIWQGTLALSGSGSINKSSEIIVGSGATFDVSAVTNGFHLTAGQTLRGSGSVTGEVTIDSGAKLQAGSGSGTLNIGGVSFTEGSTFAADIGSGGATRLNVTGSVTLNNATLALAVSGITPTDGQLFFIVTNDSTDSVTGTFNNLAQGDQLTIGGNTFQISYAGDSTGNTFTGGNDIVLKAIVSPIPEPAALSLMAAGLLAIAGKRIQR